MVEEKTSSIDEILIEARRELDFQFQSQDAFDTKSGILLGIAGVVITLVITALVGISSLILRIVALPIVLVLFTSLFLSYQNIRIREWKKPPDIEALIKNYEFQDAYKTKCNIAGTIKKAIKQNNELLQERIRLYKRSYKVLFVGLCMVVISVILLVIFPK